MRFFIFLVGVVGGLFFLIYHRQIMFWVGSRIGWAERLFGPGGTVYAYIIFGLLAIFLGLIFGFGIVPLF